MTGDLGDVTFGVPEGGPELPQGPNSGFDATFSTDVRQELARLRQTVERDHDHRLQRIETDLRWIMTLVSAQLVALIGGAIATFTVN